MGISYRASAIPVRTGEERATLVRRTYATVLAGIVVTMLGVMFAWSNPAIMGFAYEHYLLFFFLGVMGPLFLATRAGDQFPANAGFFALFTFAEGVWLSPLLFLAERASPGIVSQAGVLTLSTFGVLTLYATVSRRDFSAWGGFFTIGLWVLIGTSLLNLFFHNATANLWIAAATVLVFSGLLVYRTWLIRNVYGPNQYIQAAIGIYLALLNLFIAILSLLSGGRRR